MSGGGGDSSQGEGVLRGRGTGTGGGDGETMDGGMERGGGVLVRENVVGMTNLLRSLLDFALAICKGERSRETSRLWSLGFLLRTTWHTVDANDLLPFSRFFAPNFSFGAVLGNS